MVNFNVGNKNLSNHLLFKEYFIMGVFGVFSFCNANESAVYKGGHTTSKALVTRQTC
jgi:hypothetical protein